MTLPKLILLDRDSTLNFSSSNPESPLYYITKLEQLIIKPGAREAAQLIQASGIRMVLATRQRCISKGLVSRETVDLINARLERMLGVSFHQMYVEPAAENKTSILKEIVRDYQLDVSPTQMAFFDDSPREINVAQALGITAIDGTDLLGAVKTLLQIK